MNNLKYILILAILLFTGSTLLFGEMKFVPMTPQQLKVHLLNTKQKEIKTIESSFKLNDLVDGTHGRSTIESNLYAALVFGEDKTAVLNAIYYLELCLLKNDKNKIDYLMLEKL